MRIEGGGQRGQIHLQQLVVVGLVHPLAQLVIALRDLVLGRLAFQRRLLGGQLEQVELDPLAPAILHLGIVLGIGNVVRIGDHLFVG